MAEPNGNYIEHCHWLLALPLSLTATHSFSSRSWRVILLGYTNCDHRSERELCRTLSLAACTSAKSHRHPFVQQPSRTRNSFGVLVVTACSCSQYLLQPVHAANTCCYSLFLQSILVVTACSCSQYLLLQPVPAANICCYSLFLQPIFVVTDCSCSQYLLLQPVPAASTCCYSLFLQPVLVVTACSCSQCLVVTACS